MTNRWLVHWLQSAWWLKAASLLLLTAVLAALFWLCWLAPALQRSQELEQQQRQAAGRYRQQLQQLQGRPALGRLRDELTRLQAKREDDRVFALSALLSASGARLQHWQPAAGGGELAVTLQWPQYLQLLGYLSTLRPPVAIVQLSLQGEAQALRLRVTLAAQETTGGAQ